MPPRAPSRSQQAFRWLLEGDREESGSPGSSKQRGKAKAGSGGKGGKRSGSGGAAKDGRTFIPGFKLRCEAEAEAAGAQPVGELKALQEAFEGVLPPDVVADVLAQAQGNAATASEALLALAGGAVEGATSGKGPDAQQQQAQPSVQQQQQQQQQQQAAPAGGPCYWDELPAELQALVFEQLSLKDMARAAGACREFAAYVREQRRSLRTVIVPEGVSLTAVRGLVASYACAPGVALWRCAAQLRFDHEFEAMLRAVAAGEADRQGGVPVSELSLARCGAVTDGVVAALCDALPHLRRVDLSRCAEVGDAAVARLAAYTRRMEDDGADSSGAEDGEEQQQDAEREGAPSAAAGAEASQAMSGLQLQGEGGGASPPRAPAAARPAMESPDAAVRRIAAQHHETMMARSAAAAREQHRLAPAGLQELLLRETSVSARGAKLLLQPGSATAKSLKVLDVSRCPNLGGDALDVHPRCALETLRAAGCTALRSVVVQLPAEAPLRVLSLEGCRQLLEALVVAPRLETAAFSHCGQLRHVSLRCRRLRELRAVNCGNLSLTASELHCPQLREANFFGCRLLDAEGIEAAAASLAQCTRLDLTGCTALSRLLLPDAVALQSVSVSGCGLLRQAVLASPALARLKAAGCSRLMELRLGNAALRHLDLTSCGHLREVQLSAASRASLDGAAAWQQRGEPEPVKRVLILKGCTSLPDGVKQRLRDAVLGSA